MNLSSQRVFVGLVAMFAVALVSTNATAQQGFDSQSFSPMPGQRGNLLSVSSGSVLEQNQWEVGMFLNFADDPLVLFREDEVAAILVDHQLTANLLFSYGIHEMFEVGLDVPLILVQSGEPVAGNVPATDASDAGFGIGDIRLVPKLRLVAPEGHEDDPRGFYLAFVLDTKLPTGDADVFQGEGFRMAPRIAADFRLSGGTILAANLGFAVRPEADQPGLEVNDTFDWGLAAEIPITEKFHLVPEIAGGVSVLADELDSGELPMEGRLALRFLLNENWMIQPGGGVGITEGFGTPLWRAFLGIAYTTSVRRDSDGDGYYDDEDECPLDPEDFDTFEDEDGCPDPDNDQDGILDVVDDCPMVPEDIDGFEDEDGCPDPDNDADGILDVDDVCPMDPEDYDTFEDEDGCPDPDNDEDRILDVDDECPMDPEVYNGFEDEDGCPDVGIVTVTCDQIEFNDTIEFETDSDVIRPVSFGLLDQIVGTVVARDDIWAISIEGHTDSRGSSRHNQDLSERRAASVMLYLVEHGIDPGRLTSTGFGEDRPIDSNNTAEGRQRNRRVEFVITEQEGCQDAD